MGLIQKAFSDIITFSRSSNATRIGPTGRVEYAPHNLIVRSQELDNAAWTKSDGSVTPNAIAAPDGTITADLFYDNTSNSTHYIVAPGTFSATTYTMSIYAKSGGRTVFAMSQGGSSSYIAYFDLSAGTVTSQTGVTASIASVGNGWYRCSIVTNNSTGGGPYYFLSSGGSLSYTGNGSSGIYFWGAQLSVGSVPGDYTPTTSAAVYGPRFDFDPVTLAARGLLIEEQRTNSLTYSEDFTNAAWTKGGSTITANAATAPDGTVTADKLVEDSSTGNHWVFQNFSNTNTTLSVFAKAAERSYVGLAAAGQGLCFFNLSNGTIVSTAANCVTSITSVGNGWYRCSVAATGTGSFAIIGASADGTTVNYTGNGSSGIFIWGAQLEAGSFATSYIPTVASTVTRSADVASVNTLSPWFNASAGTLFAEGAKYAVESGGRVIAELGDGTASNFGELYVLGETTTGAWAVVSGGVTSANISVSNTFPALTVGRIAGSYEVNSFQVAGNGSLGTRDTSGAVPVSISALFIGKYGGGTSNQWNGWIRRIAYYPRALSNAELQALTA